MPELSDLELVEPVFPDPVPLELVPPPVVICTSAEPDDLVLGVGSVEPVLVIPFSAGAVLERVALLALGAGSVEPLPVIPLTAGALLVVEVLGSADVLASVDGVATVSTGKAPVPEGALDALSHPAKLKPANSESNTNEILMINL